MTPPARWKPLGTLEERVMEILWRAPGGTAVREVASRLGDRLAYTTVMTTLDRLFKKGLATRVKDGTAFVYQASTSRDEYHRRLAEHAVHGLLSRSGDPVLMGFVDAVSAVDEENLARLEKLIAARRKAKR